MRQKHGGEIVIAERHKKRTCEKVWRVAWNVKSDVSSKKSNPWC